MLRQMPGKRWSFVSPRHSVASLATPSRREPTRAGGGDFNSTGLMLAYQAGEFALVSGELGNDVLRAGDDDFSHDIDGRVAHSPLEIRRNALEMSNGPRG